MRNGLCVKILTAAFDRFSRSLRIDTPETILKALVKEHNFL